jgi:hypothetical protein
METATSLDIYKEIKTTFGIAPYLQTIENNNHRYSLARLRLHSHKLNIEVGRYYQIPRENRKCMLCTFDNIEDEFHFVLKCPVYNELRAELIPRYYYTRTSVKKYITLMQTTNKNNTRKLATYYYKAFKLRDSLI